MKISVIIPTYKRPGLLEETLRTVWAQTQLPDEILIGDDSPDDITENLVTAKLTKESPVPIRYFHHKPSLREVRNVEHLYGQAAGELVLHLHDDDPVYPNCVELLARPFAQNPKVAASFGLQHLIEENGALAKDYVDFNRHYFRTADRAGFVDGRFAGAVGMFPNNGFMIRRDVAVEVGYRDDGRAGLATDFYFGFRVGQLGRPFYFVPEVTAMCRLTAQSQSRTANANNVLQTVKILLEDLKPDQITPEIEAAISARMPIAIHLAALNGERMLGWKWLFSKYYRRQILTPRGIKRVLLLLGVPGL